MTDELFSEWCHRNQISPETKAYIQRIRTSQPVRKVRSGISNICGRYPSVKMGRTIQFESQHIKLWGIYEMERNEMFWNTMTSRRACNCGIALVLVGTQRNGIPLTFSSFGAHQQGSKSGRKHQRLKDSRSRCQSAICAVLLVAAVD